ncbi:hypothetical protein EON63_24535 [archaeon]|nr:MAG: hypothetical protein EON63_24535 [archaeon]
MVFPHSELLSSLKAEAKRAKQWKHNFDLYANSLAGGGGAGGVVSAVTPPSLQSLLEDADKICVDLSVYTDQLSSSNKRYGVYECVHMYVSVPGMCMCMVHA